MNPTKFVVSKTTGEIMVIHPSGKVEFLGFFASLLLMWKLLRSNKEVDIGE